MNRMASVVVASVATVLIGGTVAAAAGTPGLFGEGEDDHEHDGSPVATETVVTTLSDNGLYLVEQPGSNSGTTGVTNGSYTQSSYRYENDDDHGHDRHGHDDHEDDDHEEGDDD